MELTNCAFLVQFVVFSNLGAAELWNYTYAKVYEEMNPRQTLTIKDTKELLGTGHKVKGM